MRFWLLGLLFIVPQAAAALGLSPAVVEVYDVTNQSTVTRVFNISRSEANQDDHLLVTVSGSGASAIILQTDRITLLAGDTNYPYSFTLQPSALLPGTYQARFQFTLDQSAYGDAAQIIINPGIETAVTFSVTNDTIERYTIQSVEMNSAEENQPVGFSYVMSNTGNVDTRPARIELRLVDELDPNHTYAETIPAEELPIVPAFVDKMISYETNLSTLPPALYNVTIAFYDQTNQLIHEIDTLHWQVMNQAENPVDSAQPGNYWLFFSIGCGILLLGVLIWYIRKQYAH